LNFFSSIFRVLCTGTKGQKVVLFGFSTGIKSEKLNFYSSNILNSLLVPVLNPKSTNFWPLVPVQSTLKIEEKNSKKFFLGFCTFGPKNFGAAFGTWYYLQKKLF
jgi:hypothetical protein